MSWLRRKDTSPSDATVSETTTVFKLTKDWNVERGMPCYSLLKADKVTYADGDVVLKHPHWVSNIDDPWSLVATGDFPWAQRTAEHYELEIPE